MNGQDHSTKTESPQVKTCTWKVGYKGFTDNTNSEVLGSYVSYVIFGLRSLNCTMAKAYRGFMLADDKSDVMNLITGCIGSSSRRELGLHA